MSEGLLWALAGAIIWGFQNVFSKRGMGAGDALVTSWVSVVMGGGLATVAALALGQLPAVGRVEGWHLLLLVLGGIANYNIGRSVSYLSIRRIGVARAAPVGASWVVFAALLAVPLFGEPLTPRLLLGLALVFGGGLLLASR